MKKMIFGVLVLPFCLVAMEPVFYMPMDGSPDVIGADGKKVAAGVVHGRQGYVQGVAGQAVNASRHAYDQATAVTFKDLPAMNTSSGTVSFWFKPSWKENDSATHWIITGYQGDRKFRFYMVKSKNGHIDLSILSPDQMQILAKNVFKKDVWGHIAFTWDQPSGTAILYANGREVGRRVYPNRMQAREKSDKFNVFFGLESTDRFKAEVGNGLYDELKVFDKALSPDEIFVLATGSQDENFKPVSLDVAERRENNIAFAVKFSEDRLPGPKKLLVLKGENPKDTISFTAMGFSGKLSMIVNSGGTVRSVESSYSFKLKSPHKIAIEQSGMELVLKIDDAVQGKVTLAAPYGKVTGADAADGVVLAAPSVVPAKDDSARVSRIVTTQLEDSLWSLDDAEKAMHGVRDAVTLNGYWRTIPVNDYTYAPPAGEWGYMRVPGSFRSPLWQMYLDKTGKLESQNWQWNEQDLIKYRAAWYQRVFEVPANMKDGRLWLNFANLNGDAGRVYLNGKLVKEFRQDGKCFTVVPNACRIDVTDVVAKDGKNLLTVFIDRHFVGLWRGVPSIGDHKEIAIDDVWLERSPGNIALKTGIALPSFRRKEVTLRTRIQNDFGVKGRVKVCYTFEKDGRLEKNFTSEVELDGAPEQIVVTKEAWRNPILWNCENPELYKMKVSLIRDGKEMDTLPVKNFGFRESWVEDGNIILNGIKTRLRMYTSPGLERVAYYYGTKDSIGQYVSHVKHLNYDTLRFNPFRKSSIVAWKTYLDECDRQGLYNLFPMIPYEDENMAVYTEELERFLDVWGNHPNIIMWYTDFNTCSHPWNQDPAKLNDTEYRPAWNASARARQATAEKTMRAIDSSREIFSHAGGNTGKIFTSMNYQSFGTPLQEQEDWPKQWSQKHTQPLMVVESAFPYPAQFWRFDTGDFRTVGAELAAEHAARYFGDAVYAKEPRPVPYADHWHNSPYAKMNPSVYSLTKMLYSHVVPAWRAYDMSGLGDFPGERDLARSARTYNNHSTVYAFSDDVKTSGLKPDVRDSFSEVHRHLLTDYSQREGLDDTVRAVFEPYLVFLGGKPEDFTNKDHAFFSGEKFEKSIVVVNDRTTAQTRTFRWNLTVNGNVVDEGELTEKAEPGGILKLPIRLVVPKVYKRTDAMLNLMVLEEDSLAGEDSMALQFFPRPAKRNYADVAAGVYDPEGRTTKMLEAAGYPFSAVKTLEDVKKCRTLIIGAGALKKGEKVDLLQQVEDAGLIESGLKVVVFEQKDCDLAGLVFAAPSYRNAFIRRADSPFVQGLKDEDFSNWRGDAQSVPAFVVGDERSPHYPRSKWKCGNGGIVSGNVIRKPSYGNFKTIVDCGFNLMFASLMELRKGHGQILFCQLDVVNRYGKDPVATKVVDNILAEMSNRFVPVGPQRVGYMGDEEGEKWLKNAGVEYKRIHPNNPWAIFDIQTLIVGNNPVTKNNEKSFTNLFDRVSVVFLPNAPVKYLPDGIKTGEKLMFKASVPKEDVLFAGIPDADLYFRKAKKLPVFTEMPDWTIATKPAVFAKLDKITTTRVMLGLAPEQVDGYWNEEKIARVWSTILNNMNIATGKDLKLFTPGWKPYIEKLDLYDVDAFHNW